MTQLDGSIGTALLNTVAAGMLVLAAITVALVMPGKKHGVAAGPAEHRTREG